jgi:glycosyltransferase involved in cell wall biosynthesis
LPAAGHPDAWADALAAVFQNPVAATERAVRARAHAREQLTRARMVQDYAALFERLAAGRRLAQPPRERAP